jgi:hypothetical protein
MRISFSTILSFIAEYLKVWSLQPGRPATPISSSISTASTKHCSASTALRPFLPMNFRATRQRECRCASRAARPRGLETAFKKIWGEDSVGVFELAPLRRKDVTEAATQRGIDPQRFLNEVHTAHAEVFALKPLTLTLLFRIYRNSRIRSSPARHGGARPGAFGHSRASGTTGRTRLEWHARPLSIMCRCRSAPGAPFNNRCGVR